MKIQRSGAGTPPADVSKNGSLRCARAGFDLTGRIAQNDVLLAVLIIIASMLKPWSRRYRLGVSLRDRGGASPEAEVHESLLINCACAEPGAVVL